MFRGSRAPWGSRVRWNCAKPARAGGRAAAENRSSRGSPAALWGCGEAPVLVQAPEAPALAMQPDFYEMDTRSGAVTRMKVSKPSKLSRERPPADWRGLLFCGYSAIAGLMILLSSCRRIGARGAKADSLLSWRMRLSTSDAATRWSRSWRPTGTSRHPATGFQRSTLVAPHHPNRLTPPSHTADRSDRRPA